MQTAKDIVAQIEVPGQGIINPGASGTLFAWVTVDNKPFRQFPPRSLTIALESSSLLLELDE